MSLGDTRAYPRYALEVDAEVKLSSRSIPVRTRDVSKGGMCVFMDEALPLGTELGLSLALVFDESTFSEPLKVRARVVWCTALGETRYQIGASFFGLTAEARSYLDVFLRYLQDGRPDEPGGDDDGENEFG